VRSVAIPVGGLITGAAVGLTAADLPALDLALTLLLAYLVISAFALHRAGAESLALLSSVAVEFGVGGTLLSARAWHDAWRTPLRVAFETEAARHGRDAVSGVVIGTLRSDAAVRDNRVTLSLAVQALEVHEPNAARLRYPAGPARAEPLGGAALTVSGDLARSMAREWRRGRTLRVPVQLRRPRRYLNPGAPDDDRASARRGIALVGSVKSGALVDVLARGSPWSELCGAARDRIRRTVTAHVGRWSQRSAALVTAILIGDRAGLSGEMVRTLQEAGTYHTVAISGGNIAILAGITLAVFRWSGVLGRGAMLTAIAAFLAYGELVESSASVTRAIVSAVLYFAGRTLDQRIEPAQAIVVAAGLLVAIDPLAIVDPGFLLSFGATAGIVAVFTRGPAGLVVSTGQAERWPVVARQVSTIALASLAAEAALLPIVATYFGRVTLAGLGLNMIAIPAMTVAQVAGMLLVPAAMISGSLATVVGGVAAFAGVVLLESGRLVTWLPALSWRVAAPSLLVVALYYAAAAAAVAARRPGATTGRRLAMQRGCTWAALASAFWIAAEPWTVAVSRGDGRLHAVFIDVGQGDAAFIRFPRGATMLIDTGGSPSDDFDVGDRVVGPLLKHLGARRVDTIVVTHGDVDHAGGAASLLREFQPFDLWEGVPVPPLPLLAGLRRQALDAGTRWTTVQRHDSFVVDDVRVFVWHPGLPDWERQQVRNDDSIVMELRWRDVSIVLAGDVGREVEQGIQDRFATAPLRLLKVPHHGSLTSSSEGFVRALRPRVAVVSAGRGNPFNHPASAVLQRYEAVGAAVFRTDRDGAVTVETDGHRLAVRGYTGRQASWPGP
jgi:competence protein ComEC